MENLGTAAKPATRELVTFAQNWNASVFPAAAPANTVLGLLGVCAALTGAKAAVEVGSHNGATGLALFEGMSADSVLTSVEEDPEKLRLARETFAEAGIVASRTRLIAAVPHEVLQRLTDAGYDLFVAGGRPAEHNDMREQAARLLRPGGIAIFLDVEDAADPAKREADQLSVRAFCDEMAADERWLSTLLPVESGVLLAVLR